MSPDPEDEAQARLSQITVTTSLTVAEVAIISDVLGGVEAGNPVQQFVQLPAFKTALFAMRNAKDRATKAWEQEA